MHGFQRVALDQSQEHVRRHATNFDQGLPDGGQRGRHLGGEHDIVEANDAHHRGDLDVALVERAIDSCRLRIVPGKNGGRWLRELKQGAGLLVAVAEQIVAFEDEGGVNRQAGGLVRFAVAGQARA